MVSVIDRFAFSNVPTQHTNTYSIHIICEPIICHVALSLSPSFSQLLYQLNPIDKHDDPALNWKVYVGFHLFHLFYLFLWAFHLLVHLFDSILSIRFCLISQFIIMHITHSHSYEKSCLLFSSCLLRLPVKSLSALAGYVCVRSSIYRMERALNICCCWEWEVGQ